MLALRAVEQQVVVQLLYCAAALLIVSRADGNFKFLFLVEEFSGKHRLFGLSFQHRQAFLVKPYYVLLTEDILLGAFEFLFCLCLLVQEQRNSRSLLEDLTALGSPCVDYLSDPALPDDGIAISAKAGAQQHLLNVLQSGLRAVYQVLALTAAVKLAGDSHLVGVHCERAVGVVYA